MSPRRIHLKRDEQLTIEWPDETTSVFPIAMLRKLCPCASCKELRKRMATNRLTILGEATSGGPVTVDRAERVGNYALRLTWTDGHDTGIYSWAYLRELGEGRMPSTAETWPRH